MIKTMDDLAKHVKEVTLPLITQAIKDEGNKDIA